MEALLLRRRGPPTLTPARKRRASTATFSRRNSSYSTTGEQRKKQNMGASFSLPSGQPTRLALRSERSSSKTGMGIPKASSLLT